MSAFEHGYAVVVGVAGYQTRGLPPLSMAVLNDAVDVARTLWDPDLCGYRADRVRLLLEEQATAQGIQRGLEWLSERCTDQDTAIFFFSGHGWQNGGDSYLAAYDTQVESPMKGIISSEELTNRLRAIRAGRLAVFLDSCFSGGAAEIKGYPSAPCGGLDERVYEKLAEGRGRALIASSGPTRESIVLNGQRNSLFTSCLLRGLHGEAESSQADALGIYDLFQFVSQEVRQLSLERQEPVWKAQITENFSIALRRAGRPVDTTLPAPPTSPEPDLSQPKERTISTDFYFEVGSIGKVKQASSRERA